MNFKELIGIAETLELDALTDGLVQLVMADLDANVGGGNVPPTKVQKLREIL